MISKTLDNKTLDNKTLDNKTLVLGDIHGRTIWKDIIDLEQPDLTIFLGDYVSTHDHVITEQNQIDNLENILKYKESHPDKVIMLRGNHDTQHLGYYWAECSGYCRGVGEYMMSNKDRFLENTQWIHVIGDTIFSHAGISKPWMDNSHIDNVLNINELEPSELFGFTSDRIFDMCGDSKTQPPTWIRPATLAQHCIDDYDQVVGHTPVKNLTNISKAVKRNRNILLCDCLGTSREYLLFNPESDEKFIIKKYTKFKDGK